MGTLDDFPPELLTKIFLNLAYKSLLRVMAVCVRWNAIVAQDPSLAVHMFKKCTQVYVEPGSRSHEIRTFAPEPEPLRLHPAVQHASYFLGDSVKEVAFYNINRGTKVKLINLAIANDFASIPVVTMITIRSQQPVWGIDLKAKVKNGKGVKVIDIFTALEKEFNRRIVTGYGVTTRAERCGDHRHYEGLRTLIRSGLGLKTDLYLGS